ncbi:MAG: GNAT family N-acetyltransferase [Rubrobacteraceae bacterium]
MTTREDVDSENSVRAGVRRDSALSDAGLLVRPLDEVDLGSVRDLRSVVQWSADPRAFDLLRGARDARWTVAEAPDGSLAGMVGAVPLGEVGILCHLAVHDDYRGLGLGGALSSWAVAYLRSRGARLVRLYSTRRAEGLYASMGFKPIGPRTVYRLEEAPRRGFQKEQYGGHRVETMLLGDLPEVYGVDRWSYGADRSALIFAALRLHPGGGLVARDASGRVKGYLVRSSSPRATRIGPFLASTQDVARLLLSRALRDGAGKPVEGIVPSPEVSPAHGLLREFGFLGRPDRLRMELGETISLRQASPGLVHYGTTPYLAT